MQIPFPQITFPQKKVFWATLKWPLKQHEMRNAREVIMEMLDVHVYL